MEFKLRALEPPLHIPPEENFENCAKDAPIRPRHPNASDVLYRYDQRRYLDSIISDGSIRLRPASNFDELDGDSARRDAECAKSAFLPGKHTHVTSADGRRIAVLGDVKRKVGLPNYYLFCMATDWDRELAGDFSGSDGCLVISNTAEFISRIESVGRIEFPNWLFHHNPVEYFDPSESFAGERIDPALSKDFKFAYQREYRFVWMPPSGISPNGFRFLRLGSLEACGNVYTIPRSNTPEGQKRSPAKHLSVRKNGI